MVEIRVIDEGMGIDADDLPTLFDLFSQSAHALDHSQGGLGIGLALVQGLVEMHGGTVTAVSQGKGTGSEFVVRLPLCNPEVCTATQPVPVDPIPACRVLVVDDRRDNEYLLKALVNAVGTILRRDVDIEHSLSVFVGVVHFDLIVDLDDTIDASDGFLGHLLNEERRKPAHK